MAEDSWSLYTRLVYTTYIIVYFTAAALSERRDIFLKTNSSSIKDYTSRGITPTISHCAQICQSSLRDECISYAYDRETGECHTSAQQPVYVSAREGLRTDNALQVYQSEVKLYAYGNDTGDEMIQPTDDDCELAYDHELTIFGRTFYRIHVCPNGLVSLNTSVDDYEPDVHRPDDDKFVIGVYWTDNTFEYGGTHWSRIDETNCTLSKLSEDVSAAFQTDFKAEWSLVSTWDQVRSYDLRRNDTINSTYQMVITSGGEETYVIFLYDSLNWPGEGGDEVAIGFFNGLSLYHIPHSLTDEIRRVAETSNIAVNGKWMYRISDDTPAGVMGECEDLCYGNGRASGLLDPQCACKEGYEGEHCQIEPDACLSQPCGEGESCTDLRDGYCCG